MRRVAIARSLILLALAVLSIACIIPRSHAWSLEGHQIIVKYAVALLPPSWKEFFEYYGWLLNETTTYPDTYYRELNPTESPRHYVDLEVWNPNSPSTGTLPQSVSEFGKKMQSALEAGDWNSMFLYAGRVAHYMADATQPYHSTINYDPQTKNGVGLHQILDASIAAHISEFTIVNSSAVTLSPIGNLTVFALDTAIQSHSFLPVINQTLIDEGLDWSPEPTRIVENRTNTAIIDVARVWYTAILSSRIEAPVLPSVNRLSIVIENLSFTSESSTISLHVDDALGVKTDANVQMVLNNSIIPAFVANVFPPAGEYVIVLAKEIHPTNFTLTAARTGYDSSSLHVQVPQSINAQSLTQEISTVSPSTRQSATLQFPSVTTFALIVMLVTFVVLIWVRKRARDS